MMKMGSEIDIYVEIYENGKWKYYPDMNYDVRNYNIFSLLAGIRNDYKCEQLIPDDRGLDFNSLSQYVRDEVPEDCFNLYNCLLLPKDFLDYMCWNCKFEDTTDNTLITPLEVVNEQLEFKLFMVAFLDYASKHGNNSIRAILSFR